MCDSIIIDRKVALQFIHQANHLSLYYISDVCQEISIPTIFGKKTTIGAILNEAKDRIETLSKYMQMALDETTTNKTETPSVHRNTEKKLVQISAVTRLLNEYINYIETPDHTKTVLRAIMYDLQQV